MERGKGCFRQAQTKIWSLAATFWFYRENGSILRPSTSTKYPHVPISKLWKGNVNTRSVEAKPFDRVQKLFFIWGPFKPEFSILEYCCASQYKERPQYGPPQKVAAKLQNLVSACLEHPWPLSILWGTAGFQLANSGLKDPQVETNLSIL